MTPGATKPKVLIVGAGIGGLTLGAILEKANIPYEIFEKASALKHMGSAIRRWPSSSRRKYKKKNDFHCGNTFGWPSYLIPRPNLHSILLSLIPPERIHLSRRVLSHVETGIGIIVRTSDNMTHDGSTLVGADGIYSAVRQSLYEHLDKRGLLPSSDKEPLRYSTICLVGRTRLLEPKEY
ncbi:hypothetical protein BGX26_001864 [Mortierella sp. AD094]|nr:hypothetical protein BGX26_001864 [Mortierella sp. AD094]